MPSPFRDLSAFAAKRYDLVVVGGGSHGLFAAYDAADRGLSVALVERADYGSGLSFNHQRTIHGGIRALEGARFDKVRADILERRNWARMAPHLIRPLPFLIGTYRFSKRSRAALRAGFAVYDFIGRARNVGVPAELHLPKARLESRSTTRHLFPGVREAGLTGGAIWYDYQALHPDRLNWTLALAARAQSASLLNYVEAVSPLRAEGRVQGVRVRDLLSGREADVLASATLLAAGGSLPSMLAAWGLEGAPPLLRAMNLLLNRPARDIGVAAAGAGGRMLTTVPWRGCTLAGTYQSLSPVSGDEPRAPRAAVDQMLADVNATFPRLAVSYADIRIIHHGLTPAIAHGTRADLLTEPRVIRHASQGAPGLFSLVGVKFTTARRAAALAVDAVCHDAGRARQPCRTASRPLPHAGIADVEGRLTETLRSAGVPLDRDVMDHLSGWYGTEASAVVRFSAERSLLDRLTPETAILAGEIVYAAEHAEALDLSDAVLRRTPLGSAGHPGRAAIDRAATLMAQALGWSQTERDAQIARLERAYPEP